MSLQLLSPTARKLALFASLLALSLLLDPYYATVGKAVELGGVSGELKEALLASKFMASGLGVLLVGFILSKYHPRSVGIRTAFAFWLAVGLASLPASVLKGLVGRERPSHPDQVAHGPHLVLLGPKEGMHHASCQSFPSGHTTSAFAEATVLSAACPSLKPVAYAVASAAGLSRVAAGEHFPSDVVAGAGLGHLCALLILRVGFIRRWLAVR